MKLPDCWSLPPWMLAILARWQQRCDSASDAVITIIADNDEKPDRLDNPGVAAATKAARTIGARLAVPPLPGDANDLTAARGSEAIARLIAEADFIPESEPTYPAPRLSVAEARERLHGHITKFIDEVSHYWARWRPRAGERPPIPVNQQARSQSGGHHRAARRGAAGRSRAQQIAPRAGDR
jgi:hypothetical protein